MHVVFGYCIWSINILDGVAIGNQVQYSEFAACEDGSECFTTTSTVTLSGKHLVKNRHHPVLQCEVKQQGKKFHSKTIKINSSGNMLIYFCLISV